MRVVLLVLALVPALGTVAAVVLPARISGWVATLAGVVCLVLTCVLLPRVATGTAVAVSVLRVDPLSAVFVLATAFLYATTSLYSVGYVAATGGTHSRRLMLGLNLFAWTLLLAPLMNGLALLWIAVEVTTVVSALLVAHEDTDEATEAAWKYIVLASVGLGIALLATIFMYAAGAARLGTSFDLELGPLVAHAGELPKSLVLLAFCLAVVGFGTKVGLVPMHAWLPDAHAEAPTPVSALLSGSLLVVSFYAVLRYFEVARRALGPEIPQRILLVFGVLSLVLAAFSLLEQHNLKRMLAYSSIEHMGILAIGVGFGIPAAAVGVLLHVLAHAAAKSGAFMGAGVLAHTYGTKRIERIRRAQRVLPWSGPILLLSVLVLSALPPFGIFRSEFLIVRGGLEGGRTTGVALLVVLVTVAFFGLASTTTRMVVGPRVEDSREPDATLTRGEPSVTMVVAMVVGLVALLVLGVHPPAVLTQVLHQGSVQLTGGA